LKTQHPQIITTSHGIFPIKNEEIKKYLRKARRQTVEIVFFGSDPWSIYVLNSLEDNFDVKAVVTASNSSVADYFKGPILTPVKLDENFISYHSSLISCDLFVVASYGKIIPQSILDIPKYGALNIHPSLLPKYRGPSPVPATILNGDKETGVTIIKMDSKMDHGPIVSTSKISLSGQEDLPVLITKLFQLGAELLVKIIPDFVAGRLKPKAQNHSKATFCPRLTRKSGYFDITSPPDTPTLDKMIRAYSPWPGVWTNWKRRIVKFYPEGKIQMEGKKVLSLNDFLNGYPDFPLKSYS